MGADLQEEAGICDGLARRVPHGLMHEQRHRGLDTQAGVQRLRGAGDLRRDREHPQPPLQLIDARRAAALIRPGICRGAFLDAVDQERVLERDLQDTCVTGCKASGV